MKKPVYFFKPKYLNRFLLTITFILIFQNLFSQMTHVPDNNFEQKLIDLGYDSGDLDDYVLTANISEVKELRIGRKNISDLTGIEGFSALEILDCNDNQLTNLDVSKNLNLTSLDCNSNQLTNLDISKNIALTRLECFINQLSSLDISGNPNLEYLRCLENKLTNLDVSQNTALTFLGCGVNQLSSLDVSANTNLEVLNCDENQLTNLDISHNQALTYIDCMSNYLTQLDVSNNNALTSLNCHFNQITNLDVSQNLLLQTLYCGENQLTDLDVSQNPQLTEFWCNANNLTELNMKNGNNNILIELNATENPDLVCIEVNNAAEAPALSLWTKDETTRYSEDCNSTSSLGCTYDIPLDLYHFNGGGGIDSVEVTTAATCSRTASPQCDWVNILSGENETGSGTIIFSVEPNPTALPRECYLAVGVENDTLSIVQDAGTPGSLMTYVPDDNFEQALIDLGYDSGELNDSVQTANIDSITILNIKNKNIADLTGIEDFTALIQLDCSDNQLTALVISYNTALTELNCINNYLTTIDVSSNTNLKVLYCEANQLTALDISHNINLRWLICGLNPLNALNVSENSALTLLNCSENQLSALNVSSNTNLTWLYCGGNQLTDLDVSSNTALKSLICGMNQLTDLDVLYNSALIDLECQNNQLNTLNVSSNTELITLSCSENQLTTLDVSTNSNLKRLYCSSNQLTSIDVSSNTALIGLFCENNRLTSLNIKNGNNSNMNGFLYGVSNGMNASNNPDLTCIEVDNTEAAAAYSDWFKDSIASYSENCNSEPMTYVPDDNFEQALIDLGYDSGELNDSVPTANIVGVTKLIIIDDNRLTDLTGIEDFAALDTLICENLLLTSLDVSQNTALTNLDCGMNPLTSLDLSQNTALKYLACFYNQLTNLDVSNNTALTTLHCYSNQLTSLDVSQNPQLTKLSCNANNLTELNLKNGNNNILIELNATENPDLVCIEVDNAAMAPTLSLWIKDATTRYSEDCNSTSSLGCTYDISVDMYNFNGGGGIDTIEVTTAATCERTASPQCDWVNILSGENETGSGKIIFSVAPNPTGLPRECYLAVGVENDTLNIIQDAGNSNILMTYVPDDNFEQALIDLGYDSGELNDSVPTAKIDILTVLDLSSKNIVDLTGLEDFTALTEFNCYNNQLTTLDVSFNTALTSLNCNGNQLTALDVTNNTDLMILRCRGNQLTALDVTNNTDLTFLDCHNNQLTALDISSNTNLTFLKCISNQFTDLDISNNTDLTWLECGDNRLSALVVTKNTALTFLECSNNQLTELDVSYNTALTELWCHNNQLIALDLSLNSALIKLWCSRNQLTILNLKNGKNNNLIDFHASSNPNLTCIEVDDAEAAAAYPNWSKDVKASYSEKCSSNCTVEVSQWFYYFDTAGGSDSVNVAVNDGCEWTATPLCEWVTITEGESGTGNGKVVFSVQVNLSDTERECYVTVENDTFNIIQEGKDLLNDEAEILSFHIEGQQGETAIGDGAIFLTMPYNSSLTALTPQIEISHGATISPQSGVEMDFTSPVNYVVTAKNKLTTKDWSVYIDYGAMINSDDSVIINELYNFYSELSGKVVIDNLVTVVGNHVTELNLSNLGLTGAVPALFSDLDSLKRLDLSHNNLSGSLPEIFGDIDDGLKKALLEDRLTFDYLNISYNHFLFFDMENVWDKLNQIPEFIYQPQKDLFDEIDTTVNLNSNLILNLSNYTSSEYDKLKWFKEGVEIIGKDDTALNLQNIAYADSGLYYCEITNTLIRDLVLKSGNIKVHVQGTTIVSEFDMSNLKIYPNPTSGEIRIEGLNSDIETSISIFNNSGQMIQKETVSSSKCALDICNEVAGIYMLIINENKTETFKIIKE